MKNGWSIKKIEELCVLRPPKAEVRDRLKPRTDVSFMPMDELGIDTKYPSPKVSRPLNQVYKSYTYFADGDILLAKITPCFQNGKLGIARNLVNGVGFGSSEFFVLRPNSHLDREYLYYFLSREDFRRKGVERMGGAVGHQRVPPEFVLSQRIMVPPFPEQRRIVRILDEAFAGIATAKANAEKNLQNARALFESHLNAIFTQRGDGWDDTTLGEACENLDSKRVPITKNKRVAGEFPYYGASGIVDYVNDYIFDEDLLLVSEDGANLLARTYPIAFSTSGKMWVNNHAHVLRFPDMASQRFMEFYLNSIKLDAYVSGMAQPKLNQKSLNSIPVPSPPIPQRQEIVASLDSLQDAIQRLESIYRRKLAALGELKKSLLHQAFSGQL